MSVEYGLMPGWGSNEYMKMQQYADSTDYLTKATGYTTGEGIVPGYGFGTEGLNIGSPVNTGPDALNLRVQFMHGVLEQVSFEQEDAKIMKLIPKEKVYSNTFEWTQFQQYGGPGDGFSQESGFDQGSSGTGAGNLFGINQSDDNFIRQILQIKYMVATRTISLPISLVRNIENPESAAEKGATLELISKANLSCYWGDSKKSINQFNGIVRQIVDYLINNQPNDYGICYDANGGPVDKYLLEDVATWNRIKFGKGDLLIQSVQGYGDTQKTIYPEARFGEGEANKGFGNDRNIFRSLMGDIRLEYDNMLRPNQPLVMEGNGLNGLPLATATLPSTTQAWVTNPSSGSAVTVVASAPSTGPFYLNTSIAATGGATTVTAPAVAPANPAGDGNNTNHLVTGANYYYAVSIVVNGLESLPYAIGVTSVNSLTSPTLINPTAINSSVTITIGFAGVTQTLNNSTKFRIYRYGGPGAVAPTSFNQFQFLCDTGAVIGGNTIVYDNGMYIPGADNAFLITTKKNGANGWFLAQLLPLMRRKGLPSFVMGDVLAMLMFVAPVLLVPRHHVWIRNVGRAN